ncbi:hypothetical protein SAY86_023762 [Trapa natans]|uniref:C2H2-type domain-containing protein n=1 Tax=Trapa natans TaxID=22666 RepID=A0AAN7M7V9_TRANT|nr:hypothetical protein SAY86_023762 [Trapa natans]
MKLRDFTCRPLLSPVKIKMQKCDKCNREFFSPINYRRHAHVQHRLKKLDKDSLKNRDLLRVFWDKLSADEAKEIVALKNATMEGSSRHHCNKGSGINDKEIQFSSFAVFFFGEYSLNLCFKIILGPVLSVDIDTVPD